MTHFRFEPFPNKSVHRERLGFIVRSIPPRPFSIPGVLSLSFQVKRELQNDPDMPDSRVDRPFIQRTLCVLALGTATAALVAVAILGQFVFLLLFGSVLLAILLKGFGDLLEHYTKIPHPWSVTVVIVVLAAGFGVLTANFSVHIVQQLHELSRQLHQARDSLEAQLQSSRQLGSVIQHVPTLDEMSSSSFGGGSSMRSWVMQIFDALFYGFILVVGSLYFAVDGGRYRRGIIALAPPRNRELTGDLLDHIGFVLWRWFLGRLFSMTVIGVATSVLLAVLNVPMPITLGVIAALFTFIPNIGAALAVAIPALLALEQGTNTFLIVVCGYVILQILESYWMTPIVQQKVVTLPAALVIFAQILAGTLFGMLGIALASPIAVFVFVLVKDLYVRRGLEDKPAPLESDKL